jgi:hypothetical protein
VLLMISRVAHAAVFLTLRPLPQESQHSRPRSSQPSAAAPLRPKSAMLRHMKVEEIAEAIAKLPPDELARFRRWFAAFESGRSNHAEELDSTATKLGRFAGRAFAELRRRAKDSQS